MKLVVIESPLAGDRELHKEYARFCMKDSLARKEAPYASHLLFDQDGLLDDDKPEGREAGMEAGFAWGARADMVAVYRDLGISVGMKQGIENARLRGTPIEYRELPKDVLALITRNR
jgi:hypothetical protein